MNYYEVMPADSRYKSNQALTYCSEDEIAPFSVVTIDLKNKSSSGLVITKVAKPKFKLKPIRAVISTTPLPAYCLEIAEWMSQYYSCSLADALKLYMPPSPVIRKKEAAYLPNATTQVEAQAPLMKQQVKVVNAIESNPKTTNLLHGETGSGKTRVYVELAKRCLGSEKSAIILTPEITLTSQLSLVFKQFIDNKIFVFHSQLTASERKKLWFEILESNEPIVVIGPRSALFCPIKKIGLIVVDESHEPAYKQDQNPRYLTSRAASHIGQVTGSKVILGSATPAIADYYLADIHGSVVQMKKNETQETVDIEIVDIKEKTNFSDSPYLSKNLIMAIKEAVSSSKQVLIYLNRRGSSRLILCNACGWQSLCPNCDIPLVYHADTHQTKCHICNFTAKPPMACPDCQNTNIIYRSVGSKALATEAERLFPNQVVRRFDGDNLDGERLNQLYPDLINGKIDILVGTQILAKGLDLPKLSLVGIVAAETSMGLPDFSSEERSFQLLHQVIGRVGRGHGSGKVIIQTYEPKSPLIKAVVKRDWIGFYKSSLLEREKYQFPPYVHLLQLTCKKNSERNAETSAKKVLDRLRSKKLNVEFIGPTPSFYLKRGDSYYYQIIVKSKDRNRLLEITKDVPPDWQISLDPINLL